MIRIDRDAEISRTALDIFDDLHREAEAQIAELFAPEGRASAVFAEITDERYGRVEYDPDDQTLVVLRDNGNRHVAGDLSQGTRDQLYLSARISLAEQLLETEPGFFLMDDAFLPADRNRLDAGFEVLEQLAEDGAIVAGSYRKLFKNKMLVGVVEPGSDIELLVINDIDGSIIESKVIEPGTKTDLDYDRADVVIYKCTSLSRVEVVTRQEQPLLFDDGVRPPFWSVCEWGGAEDQLRAIVRGDLPPYEVGSLTTDQLEIVCEEYLRIVDDAYYRTSDIGGNQADVDIMGATGEELVWAQVTQGDEGKVRNKIDKPGDYTAEDARVIIFAPAGSKPDDLDEEITFVPVEGVFASVDLNPNGSALLSRLLGRRE